MGDQEVVKRAQIKKDKGSKKYELKYDTFIQNFGEDEETEANENDDDNDDESKYKEIFSDLIMN